MSRTLIYLFLACAASQCPGQTVQLPPAGKLSYHSGILGTRIHYNSGSMLNRRLDSWDAGLPGRQAIVGQGLQGFLEVLPIFVDSEISHGGYGDGNKMSPVTTNNLFSTVSSLKIAAANRAQKLESLDVSSLHLLSRVGLSEISWEGPHSTVRSILPTSNLGEVITDTGEDETCLPAEMPTGSVSQGGETKPVPVSTQASPVTN